MNKPSTIVGLLALGALAVVGKRTYDIVKLRKDEKETNVIEIEVESKGETRK